MREKYLQRHKVPDPIDKEGKAFFLARSNLFRYLNTEELNELERNTSVIVCPPGRILYRPDEKGSSLFLLKAGSVQLYHLSTDGRKLITTTLEAGECFGEMALISEGTHNCFAEAVMESCVYVLNKHEIEQLLTQKPDITLALLKLVGQRFTRLEAQLLDTAFQSTTARLATLLLHLARPQAHDEILVVSGLSHEKLAERLGVYRETVSVALRELQTTGAIKLKRKHILINQPALLEKLGTTGEQSRYS